MSPLESSLLEIKNFSSSFLLKFFIFESASKSLSLISIVILSSKQLFFFNNDLIFVVVQTFYN